MIDFPTDDDVNQAVLLNNQIENSRPHADDLSASETAEHNSTAAEELQSIIDEPQDSLVAAG